ncbi:MAG: menaquinone biosynthesis decarboxylase [Armatimonadota bacterium]|nr:menaquinone biosynthesis decarboxylase [Armatimonadota bacterium]
MAYSDLRDFISKLESEGELVRIRHPVSPELEVTEITDRVVKSGGPALLFENVAGSSVPILTNQFGTMRRMALALGVEEIDTVAKEIESLLKTEAPGSFLEKLKALPKLARLADAFPKTVRTAPCQEVVKEGSDASLDCFPILKCWPGDGGRFITLPMVFTKDPETGRRNVGMYRMHVYDERTTGMHWHIHKVGARHYAEYERRNQRMEVAVALGGDPAITYAATAPLPEDFDEMIFAGFLRKEPVRLVKCKTVDQEVPADAEIVLEGYVDPYERRLEGPFGDHTGYYSPADYYPVFHITCITHRRNPIYPATVVGKPPMEDCFLAKATERIFLPLLRAQLPEIVDINLPIEGVFHNLAFISIRKRYPMQARKVMHALWGLGQMMFTKILVILDQDVDVQNTADVLWRLGNNVDPKRDVVFVEGPVDVLDHASPQPLYGSKMGIDATKKLPGEGHPREWPEQIAMTADVKARIDAIWEELGIG